MAQNVVVGIFEVESEAYQAITELKQYRQEEKSFLTQAILVKKADGKLTALDGFDTGADTLDDTAIGGLVGGLMGIVGGPIGVLLMGSYGAMVGSILDAGDAIDDASLIEQIAQKLVDNEVAIIALANEEDEAILDKELNKFKTTVMRYDAAVVATEVDEAQKMAAEMARQARQELRKQKKDEFESKIADKRAQIASDFQTFKDNLKYD